MRPRTRVPPPRPRISPPPPGGNAARRRRQERVPGGPPPLPSKGSLKHMAALLETLPDRLHVRQGPADAVPQPASVALLLHHLRGAGGAHRQKWAESDHAGVKIKEAHRSDQDCASGLSHTGEGVAATLPPAAALLPPFPTSPSQHPPPPLLPPGPCSAPLPICPYENSPPPPRSPAPSAPSPTFPTSTRSRSSTCCTGAGRSPHSCRRASHSRKTSDGGA